VGAVADPPQPRPSLALVRQERHRALELVQDPRVRARILDAIRVGAHARPACAAEGIPGGAFEAILGRGRAESQQWHDGQIPEPTLYGAFYDDVEKAIGQAFVTHTRELTDSFDADPKERAKWMLRRFGPEFAEASKREDELPARTSEREVRLMLLAKLGLEGKVALAERAGIPVDAQTIAAIDTTATIAPEKPT
jgi:hypothetical protein